MSFARKLYIDSRFRAPGSASHSDFTFQLPRSIELRAGTRAVVDSVQIPNVFQTVESNRSRLYLSVGAEPERVVELVEGHYNAFTLAAHLQDQLNALGDGEFTVVYNESTGRLSIDMVGASYVRLLGRDPSRPNDALDLIGAREDEHPHCPIYTSDAADA